MASLDLRSHPEKLSKGAFKQALELVIDQQVSSSQFRNYFGELRDIQRQFENSRIGWDTVKLRLNLLRARLAYGMRKDGGRLGKTFYRFLDDLLCEALEDASRFKDVMLYLEAVLAYFYPLDELFQKIIKDNKIPKDEKQKRFTQLAKREFLGGTNETA